MENKFTASASADIHASPMEVWEALTTPELINKYFFGTHAISTWEVGSPIIFKGVWEEKEYRDKGIILKSQPGVLFQYTYLSSLSGVEDKPENYVTITYALVEVGGGTKVTVSQTDIPTEEASKHAEETWQVVLNNLKGMLEKSVVVL